MVSNKLFSELRLFWSKLRKSSWNCAWNLAFAVFISPIAWNMCENLHYESVYFKELHNKQQYYWPTIYRAGAAVVSTITSLCQIYDKLKRRNWNELQKATNNCEKWEWAKESWRLHHFQESQEWIISFNNSRVLSYTQATQIVSYNLRN